MDLDRLVQDNLNNVVQQTNFTNLGERYEGKVRDCYRKDGLVYLVSTDRLSCFDRVISTVPFKGQILTQMAQHWFEKTAHIFPNHVVDCPDPNVFLVRECEILPIEVVVRGYLAGSAWRDYEAGNLISGIKFPDGMRKSEKLAEPLITPSTKAPKGEHDLPISEEEIVKQGIVAEDIWNTVREAALNLFSFGQAEALKQGLILVDTKYEFGMHDGELLIADEIHTLDSSRYWRAESYIQRFEDGLLPEMLDKENVRQWLIDQGFMGDGEIPDIPDQYRIDVSKLYINSYKEITGKEFKAPESNIMDRLNSLYS